MSDLIALIAHPEEVLTRSNAQHRKLVAHLREGDARRGGEADAPPHPRHRAHPDRARLSYAPVQPTRSTSPSGGSSAITPTPRA